MRFSSKINHSLILSYLELSLTLIGSECPENKMTTSSLSSAGNLANSASTNSEND